MGHTKHPRVEIRLTRSLICALATLMLLCVMSTHVVARALVIEGLEEEPLKWMDHEEAKGIDIDIMTEVLNTMGITNYVFRFVDTGSRLLQNARNGKSDIALTLSMNNHRARYLIYPNEAHLLLDWRFAVRADDKDIIRFEDFADLARFRIGAAADYSYTSTFWNSGLDIQRVARSDLLIPMLLQNRFDAAPVNYLNTIYDSLQNSYRDKVAFLYPPLRRAPYYNVFSRASDYPDKEKFLAEYDEIIREMRDDGRLLSIFERHLGPDGVDWWQSQYSH